MLKYYSKNCVRIVELFITKRAFRQGEFLWTYKAVYNCLRIPRSIFHRFRAGNISGEVPQSICFRNVENILIVTVVKVSRHNIDTVVRVTHIKSPTLPSDDWATEFLSAKLALLYDHAFLTLS